MTHRERLKVFQNCGSAMPISKPSCSIFRVFQYVNTVAVSLTACFNSLSFEKI